MKKVQCREQRNALQGRQRVSQGAFVYKQPFAVLVQTVYSGE